MPTIDLGADALERELRRPGVLLVHWWAPESLASELSSAAYQAAALRNPGVRFGSLNAVRQQTLARDYQVSSVPALMVFRDGILVFAGAGPFTEEQVDQLLVAVDALDMDEVRRTRNGHGKGTPAFAAPPVPLAAPRAREPSRKPLK